ncbi:MAG: hypothetical protein IKT25_09040 [Firmicutes bacterium]|nr:hypothetical protein [Bacillota bacterium]MBR6501638.1 hypothetical protein [Bacillota bacterium]
MRKSIISIGLILCLLFSTVSVFATVPVTMHMITIDGETFTFVEMETETERDVRVYDIDGTLVEHMQYNKETGVMYDVLRRDAYETEYSISLLSNEQVIIDNEGYYCMGEYVVDLGDVYSAVSAMTKLMTYGIPYTIAEKIVAKLAAEMVGTLEVRGVLWMKSDNTYDYSKKIENFYYHVGITEIHLYGPYTTYQQKRNDI